MTSSQETPAKFPDTPGHPAEFQTQTKFVMSYRALQIGDRRAPCANFHSSAWGVSCVSSAFLRQNPPLQFTIIPTEGTGLDHYPKAKRRTREHPQRAGLVQGAPNTHQTKKRRATTDEEPVKTRRGGDETTRDHVRIPESDRRATDPRPRPEATATRRRSRRPPPVPRRPPSSPRPVRGLEVARAP